MTAPPRQLLNLLLVEDERKLARALERQLTRAGYTVSLAFDGITAVDLALTREFHLIILDLQLPRLSGIEVLHEIRSRFHPTPVLILSARDEIKDRVLGLDVGADDYMTKPFDTGELLARIQAILRRAGTLHTAVLRAGDLQMDVVQRNVSRQGQAIRLTQTEFSLLEFLLRNKNTILTRRRIAEQVWGYTFDTGTNIVDVYISYLRDAVDKDFQPKLIETVRGEGFVLRDA